MQCQAITKGGYQCPREAVFGKYCIIHKFHTKKVKTMGDKCGYK